MISAFFDKDTIIYFNPPLEGGSGVEILDTLFSPEDRLKYYLIYRNLLHSILNEYGVFYIRIYGGGKNITKFGGSFDPEADERHFLSRLKEFEKMNYRILNYNDIKSAFNIDDIFRQLNESISEKFKKGDSVIAINGRDELVGKTGTILESNIDNLLASKVFDENYLSYLVSFDNWHHGHNGGEYKYRDLCGRSCWWVEANCLSLNYDYDITSSLFNQLNESEDEFDWARNILDQPIKDVVEGQYYRCDGEIASEPFSHKLDIFIKEIKDNHIIYDSISDSPDPEEREDDTSIDDTTPLSHAKKLVSNGYWVPIRKEDSLFNT